MRPPKSLSQGAELTGNGVVFRTWATGKKNVSTVIVDENGETIRRLPMKLDEQGYYRVVDPEARAGTFYKFSLDGKDYPDMASRFQPNGAHGASQVIDAKAFNWTDSTWHAPTLAELVIYEVHLGTFTSEGTYESAIERLDYLVQLGVTAIEVMPVADFAGKRNWGYDGVYLYAPAHSYGRPDDFRAFVNAAHNVGLAVILDVVYNHLGPDGNYLGVYSDHYFNESHHTPWGSAFNLDKPDSQPVRHFFAENPVYWMEEFHIDGFRLDATHAIPDDSPKHLIQEIAESVQNRGGVVICEDPRNDRKLILPREQNGYGCDAVWADDFHHVVRVQMTQENEGYMSYFKGTMEELLNTLREGWLFSGQIQKDGLARGTNGLDLEPERFVHCISNHDQIGNKAFGTRLNHVITPAAYRAASALLLTSPYTIMLFMGQEWSASTPFLYFTDHHEELGKGITEGRRKEFADFSEFNDPKTLQRIPGPQALATFETSKLLWNEISNSPHAETLRLYTDLLKYRHTNLAHRHRGTWQIDQVSSFTISVRYRHPTDDDILILAQLMPNQATIDLAQDLLRPSSGKKWRLDHSSNEPRYGGEHPASYDSEKQRLKLTEPEVVILRETNEGISS